MGDPGVRFQGRAKVVPREGQFRHRSRGGPWATWDGSRGRIPRTVEWPPEQLHGTDSAKGEQCLIRSLVALGTGQGAINGLFRVSEIPLALS